MLAFCAFCVAKSLITSSNFSSLNVKNFASDHKKISFQIAYFEIFMKRIFRSVAKSAIESNFPCDPKCKCNPLSEAIFMDYEAKSTIRNNIYVRSEAIFRAIWNDFLCDLKQKSAIWSALTSATPLTLHLIRYGPCVNLYILFWE